MAQQLSLEFMSVGKVAGRRMNRQQLRDYKRKISQRTKALYEANRPPGKRRKGVMDKELFQACVDWVDGGKRVLSYEYGHGFPDTGFWLYDHSVRQGVFARCLSDIPTVEVLVAKKKEALELELDQLGDSREV